MTNDQLTTLARLKAEARHLGATGEVIRQEISEVGALIVMIEEITGREIYVIGPRGGLR